MKTPYPKPEKATLGDLKKASEKHPVDFARGIRRGLQERARPEGRFHMGAFSVGTILREVDRGGLQTKDAAWEYGYTLAYEGTMNGAWFRNAMSVLKLRTISPVEV